MSKKRFDRYELEVKTSADILESEKTEIDEIETMLFDKKTNLKEYKNRHAVFLDGIRKNSNSASENKIQDVKRVQMSVYSSNSSELYTSFSKASVVLSVFAVCFMTLLFAVVLEIVLLFSFGYTPRTYESDDMIGIINQGDVIFEVQYSGVEEISIDTIITYNKDGKDYTRIITEMSNTQVTVNTPDGTHPEVIFIGGEVNPINKIVVAKVSTIGFIIVFCYENWYIVGGVLLVLSLVLFLIKYLIDQRYNNLLLDRMEYERKQRETRRRMLADDIIQMQQNKTMSFNNVNILSNLLNVNKLPETKREKKMRKLQEQIQKRRIGQIESIKENAEKLQNQITNASKENKDLDKEVEEKDLKQENQDKKV